MGLKARRRPVSVGNLTSLVAPAGVNAEIERIAVDKGPDATQAVRPSPPAAFRLRPTPLQGRAFNDQQLLLRARPPGAQPSLAI